MGRITFRVFIASVRERDDPDAAYPLEFRIRLGDGRTVYVGSGLPKTWVETELKPRFTVYSDREGTDPLVIVAQRHDQLVALASDKSEIAVFECPPGRGIPRPARSILPDGVSFRAGRFTIPTYIAFALLWPIWLVLQVVDFFLKDGEPSLWFPVRVAWKSNTARFGVSALKRLAVFDRFKFRPAMMDERLAFAHAVLELQMRGW
ncbi:hypothetical protein ACF06Q_05620 [Streptomyces leeuwenhoekii]|uniref:hypothetical protein n=1 Tax=Streptomyces leeuwenhoekii TaxID=1437453 RepID=UPI0036F79B46